MGTRIYVGNLPHSTNEDEVRQLFAADGRTVNNVALMVDRNTGRLRGFGFVEMGSEADCQTAIEALNGARLKGRPLVVNEARARGGGPGGPGGPRGPRPGGPPRRGPPEIQSRGGWRRREDGPPRGPGGFDGPPRGPRNFDGPPRGPRNFDGPPRGPGGPPRGPGGPPRGGFGGPPRGGFGGPPRQFDGPPSYNRGPRGDGPPRGGGYGGPPRSGGPGGFRGPPRSQMPSPLSMEMEMAANKQRRKTKTRPKTTKIAKSRSRRRRDELVDDQFYDSYRPGSFRSSSDFEYED